MENDIRVYISGPLTGAPDLRAARLYYERLAQVCRQEGLVPYLPHTESDPQLHAGESAETVFKRDLHHLLSSQLIVAFIGSPSLGVGAELALASEKDIQIIAIRRPGDTVSRFLLGMLITSQAYDMVIPDERVEAELPNVLNIAVSKIRERIQDLQTKRLGVSREVRVGSTIDY